MLKNTQRRGSMLSLLLCSLVVPAPPPLAEFIFTLLFHYSWNTVHIKSKFNKVVQCHTKILTDGDPLNDTSRILVHQSLNENLIEIYYFKGKSFVGTISFKVVIN